MSLPWDHNSSDERESALVKLCSSDASATGKNHKIWTPKCNEENMLFANDFHPTAGVIMLGITDKNVEGQWKTFDGKPVPFTKWNSGEPNNGRGGNYAWLYTKISERKYGARIPAGTWNDIEIIYSAPALCTYEPEDDDKEFCIRMTSSASDVCAHPTLANPNNWLGGTIQLKQNGEVIATMSWGTKNFEHCLPKSDVDVENDEFSLHATSSDGVCITSLYINEEQILVGKDDDLEGFWLDHDQPNCVDGYMSSSHMIFKNGKVVLSQCKPRLTNGWIETVADCYLGNRDPSRCKGGYCEECGEEGYCCSGKNYKPGTGPGNNADNLPACPQEAVDIITSNHHVCVSKAEPEGNI